MNQDSKARASRLFWVSLFLFLVSQLGKILESSSKNFQSELGASIASAFVNFALGFFAPLVQMKEMFFTTHDISVYEYAGLGLAFLAALVLFAGARVYARGKGYHGALGYLGLLGLVGVFFMVLLPDRRRAIL